MSRCGTVSSRLRRSRCEPTRGEVAGGFKSNIAGAGKMRALTGIEVKHNRRYGADCVWRGGPFEIATKIAAPHQNEGPHLAASLQARISADRSGARGKNDVPGNQRLTPSNEPKDPETVRLRRGSAPILPAAIVRGEAGPVKTSLRHAQKRRGLDRVRLPAKQKPTDKGRMGALWLARIGSEASAGLPLVGSETSRIESALKHISRF